MRESLQKLVDAGRITVDAEGVVRLTATAWRLMVKAPAVHFVGFKDDRVHNARRIFGEPDFWHRFWDHRAAAEVAPSDVVIFATGDETTPPMPFAFDDSAMQ